MSNYTLAKSGGLPDTALPSSFPQIVDMRGDAGWPTDWAIYTSTDHGAGGVYLYVADGDPSDPGNWLSYDAALAAGVFDVTVDLDRGWHPLSASRVWATGTAAAGIFAAY